MGSRGLGALIAVLGVCASATAARAQLPRPLADAGGALPPASIAGLADAQPYAPMEFSRAWLGKMEQVRRRRQELLAAGKLDGLEPAEAARLGAALTGTLRVLVVPVLYGDDSAPFTSQALADRLFGAPKGDTMSYTSYFNEVSDGLLHVTGNVTSWVRLAHPAGYYLPREHYGWGRFGKVKELREEALRQVESSVDLGQFDNDGPDGKPNSGDDDGYADFVVFVYALPCGAGADVRSGAIWPHRGAMQPYATSSPAAGGGTISIADYLILPAVDPRSCGPLQVGVLAHETGHSLGLPDLYDYDGGSQGIGAWGLMGTGSHSAPWSPAHLSAWSKEQLGWVKEVWLRRDAALKVPPVETSHTIFRYDLAGTAGEYLLLENRQRVGSDRALPGQGLLVWHVDPERAELGMWNSDARRPALAVLPADVQDPVTGRARIADAGDPFPGRTRRRSFEYLRPAGFALTGISETRGVVAADVHIGASATAGKPKPALVRLATPQGTSVAGQVLRVSGAGTGVRDWIARATSSSWLRARRDGDALVVSADPAALPPGAYADTVSLAAPDDSTFARKVVVALEVTAQGGAEVVATRLPWSWGLAWDNGRMLQAGYGWDPLGLRPRPRVLELDRDDPFPHTLVRIPSDALYAPVVTPAGDAYIVARASGENLLYRVQDDGSAELVTRLAGRAPAYGAASLADGTLLVADWTGTIQRVTRDGRASRYARLPTNVYQIAADSAGNVVAASYEGDAIRLTRDGKLTTLMTGFGRGRLVAVAAAPCGDIYVAERGGQGRIVRYGKDGKVEWSISIPGAQFYGLTVDGSFLYALDLGHRQLLRIPVVGCAPKAPVTDDHAHGVDNVNESDE